MIDMKFIPSEDNLPTNIYTEDNSSKYKYTEDYESIENRIYFDAFLVDPKAFISSWDLCIVSNPYDSEEYVERCNKVSLDDGREVFYSEEGTRCLLCDVRKVVGVRMNYLVGDCIQKLMQRQSFHL